MSPLLLLVVVQTTKDDPSSLDVSPDGMNYFQTMEQRRARVKLDLRHNTQRSLKKCSKGAVF